MSEDTKQLIIAAVALIVLIAVICTALLIGGFQEQQTCVQLAKESADLALTRCGGRR